MRGTCPPEKKAQEYLWSVSLNKFLRYSLDDIFWKVSQMTFLENNCERYSFFLPKKCVKECLRLIFPTFFEVYFWQRFCFAKTYPKDSPAQYLWEIRHRKHVNKEVYPKHVFSQFLPCAAKFPMFRECSGKYILLIIPFVFYGNVSGQIILKSCGKYPNKKSEQLLRDM